MSRVIIAEFHIFPCVFCKQRKYDQLKVSQYSKDLKKSNSKTVLSRSRAFLGAKFWEEFLLQTFKERTVRYPGQRPWQHPHRSNHRHVHGRADSCCLPWVGSCLLASVRFCGRHSAGLWWVPRVTLQEGVWLLSWPGVAFRPHHPKWGKVWSHMLAVSLQTALAFPELLPRSSPVLPIKCTEELLGKQILGTTLSHLVSTEETS